ncbi:MAG: cation diffusion facilitator family transporter, partial [Rikenellaceae bacterium]
MAQGGHTGEERTAKIYRVTLLGFVVNLLLTILKLMAGILGHSAAMVADAIHSASDFATDAVVMIFVRIAAKPEDDDHKYGHGKYETLASIMIGLLLAMVGIGLLVGGARSVWELLHGAQIERPGGVALIAAMISIVAKEALYWYTVAVARKVDSPVVMANAWHHRSDALSSIGTLIGVGCAHFLGASWAIADPLAAILVSLLILKVAYELTRSGVEEMLEKSLPAEVEARIMEILSMSHEVYSPHELRTRRIGERIAIEAHILVDGAMSVKSAHELTDEIENRLKQEYGSATLI